MEGMREYMKEKVGETNELGDTILGFVLAFDLILANTCFRKGNGHLITCKSEIIGTR